MTLSISKKFRMIFLIGLVILFSSLFLEWYIFQAYDSSGKLVAYWSYNPINGWSTIFSEKSTVNYVLKPKSVSIPLIFTGLYIINLIISAYTVLFKDIEGDQGIEKLTFYAYANLFLLMLIIYYIFVFPVFYLVPYNSFFPFLQVKDPDLNYVYHYSIGPGYFMQVIGFIMVFPYAVFYYQTIMKFKSEEQSSKQFIQRYLQTVQEPLDLDKLIAKEQVKLKFKNKSFVKPEDLTIYHKKHLKKVV